MYIATIEEILEPDVGQILISDAVGPRHHMIEVDELVLENLREDADNGRRESPHDSDLVRKLTLEIESRFLALTGCVFSTVSLVIALWSALRVSGST